jgi:hypothetical protein
MNRNEYRNQLEREVTTSSNNWRDTLYPADLKHSLVMTESRRLITAYGIASHDEQETAAAAAIVGETITATPTEEQAQRVNVYKMDLESQRYAAINAQREAGNSTHATQNERENLAHTVALCEEGLKTWADMPLAEKVAITTPAAEPAPEPAPEPTEAERHATQLEGLRATIRRLTDEQISGDDHRLANFWEKAHRVADSANFCEQFDRMAEAMDGPRRNRTVLVDHSVTVTITVRASTLQTITTDDDIEDYESASDGEGLDEELLEAIRRGDYEIESSDIQGWEDSE